MSGFPLPPPGGGDDGDGGGGGGPPSGAAGGVLTGTYPNPSLANGAVSTTAKLADGIVTSAKIDASVATFLQLVAEVISREAADNSLAADIAAIQEISADDPTEVNIDAVTGELSLLSTVARIPKIIRKSAIQSFTTNVQANVTDLVTPTLLTNSVYRITGMFDADGPSGADNLLIGWVPPTSSTGLWNILGPSTAETGVDPAASVSFRPRGWTTTQAYGTVAASTFATHIINGLLITAGTAGTLQMQASQNPNANATPHRIQAGAWIGYEYCGPA